MHRDFLASTALSCLNHNNNWLSAHFLRNIRLANNFEFLTPFQLNRRLVTRYLWSYRDLQRGNNLTFQIALTLLIIFHVVNFNIYHKIWYVLNVKVR